MKYRLYVDEVGHDDLSNVRDDRYRYLSLTGIAMDQDYVRDVVSPEFNAWKADLFRHDPDSPIILHRSDIINKKGPFGILGDIERCKHFDSFILNLITNTQYTVITAVIDKLEMQNQLHWRNQHPYHYLMEIVVEKYVQWLERKGAHGDLMPEKRHGKKDTALQTAFEGILANGTQYISDTNRISASLPGTKLKFRAKHENVTGLQLCDLIAHPSYMYVRKQQGHNVTYGPFAQKIIPILEANKYDRSPYNGRIRGYGIKYLP